MRLITYLTALSVTLFSAAWAGMSPDLTDSFFVDHASFVIWLLSVVAILIARLYFKERKSTAELRKLNSELHNNSMVELINSLTTTIAAQKDYFNAQNSSLSVAVEELTATVSELSHSITLLSERTTEQINSVSSRLIALQAAHDIITSRRKSA
jgi:hypothetical protein